MNVTEATEIRKLTSTYVNELARLIHDSWKTFMSRIPEALEKDKYNCKIKDSKSPKYNSEHIRLIEQASVTTKRLPVDILLEEWGCSGRIRPTLGHLFYLLQECRLFGAADYVAKILGRNPPQRPSNGPEARVELTPTERRQIANFNRNVSEILDEMNYPSSNIEQSNFEHHSADNNVMTQNLPQIVIDYQVDPIRNEQQINDNLNIETNNFVYDSNMIQFSSNRIPALSDLINGDSESTNQNVRNDPVEVVVPHFSALLNDSSLSEINQNSNIPNMSMFNNTITSSSESNETDSHSNLPDFDALRSQTTVSSQNMPRVLETPVPSSTSLTQRSGTTFSSQSVSIPRTLGSPLPSLTLNTLLKHYTYEDLEIATNHFNETPYVPSQELEPSCGRFLGSGAFGSVYLAFGVLDQPIAVKRINLKDLNIVSADDFITKQFTTEVEILYKYKHQNLLSLIGYSCDGMTYCLMYEYVPGGNLKDRLQNTTNCLNWKQRLDIAMGTAEAVAYLHTAYSTPLIHRDIKSANILLDNSNQAKLCDFGIIRISSNTTTGTNQILGTSAYMPPEAHRGDVSVKLDSYSFGVVLLELLTGLPPVDYERDGNDLVTYVQDNLDDDTNITPLLDLRAGWYTVDSFDFASELYKITMKCLQEKKIMRPTMVNVRDELKILLEKQAHNQL